MFADQINVRKGERGVKEQWQHMAKFIKFYPRITAGKELADLENDWNAYYHRRSEEKKQAIQRLLDEYSRLGEVRTRYYEEKYALERSKREVRGTGTTFEAYPATAV